jgi:hypothetical protein
MVAMALLIIEHDRGKLSSGILTGFWFMSLIVDAIRMRSFILQGNVRLGSLSITMSAYAVYVTYGCS